jgi:hypothetical protein
MPPPVIPSWFDLHQTFIGSLIVLLGVILGLCGNAVLQWWDRDSRRDHDRETTRKALRAELQHLVDSYQFRVDRMRKREAGGNFHVPVHVPTEVYDAMLDKVGLLTIEQSELVIKAYLGAKHLPLNLRRIEREQGPQPHTEPLEDYVTVSSGNLPDSIKLHNDRIDMFTLAIAALDGG